ncbi:methylosome protein 50-like [Anneissia japonica]|uniref:methylosome protein 50-like n=1 Tax=Anneissia japonica TaxID=1529436 RepID=UPI001425BA5C|nr:methylosome protein 50-like [Anneissia japonica]
MLQFYISTKLISISDGSLILGASGLTGRYWAGSLWFYEDPNNAPTIERCSAGVQTEAGVTDIIWIDELRIAVASDTGAVEIWQLVDSRSSFKNLFYLFEHHETVNSVKINSNRTRLASGSADCIIKIWDVASQCSTATYHAHTAPVEKVAWSPVELEVFASCSQDGRVLLWDTRKPKPAFKVNSSPLYSLPTSLAWKPGETAVIAIGDESGHIVLKDIRNAGGMIKDCQAHTRAVNRLAFSPKNGTWLASVSDDSTAVVTDMASEPRQIYRSYSHNDYVRGLSWDPLSNKLFTCGWDKQVCTHVVTMPSEDRMDIGNPASYSSKVKGRTPKS